MVAVWWPVSRVGVYLDAVLEAVELEGGMVSYHSSAIIRVYETHLPARVGDLATSLADCIDGSAPILVDTTEGSVAAVKRVSGQATNR